MYLICKPYNQNCVTFSEMNNRTYTPFLTTDVYEAKKYATNSEYFVYRLNNLERITDIAISSVDIL